MGTRILCTLILFTSAALADDDADRAKLAGTWQAEEGNTWVLENTSDAMRITQSQNGTRVSQFECNVTGKECVISENGRKAKVSMWFNGPKLIELETRGSEVVKRTFSAAGKDDAMEVEFIPVVPGGATETSHFRRTVSSAQR